MSSSDPRESLICLLRSLSPPGYQLRVQTQHRFCVPRTQRQGVLRSVPYLQSRLRLLHPGRVRLASGRQGRPGRVIQLAILIPQYAAVAARPEADNFTLFALSPVVSLRSVSARCRYGGDSNPDTHMGGCMNVFFLFLLTGSVVVVVVLVFCSVKGASYPSSALPPLPA